VTSTAHPAESGPLAFCYGPSALLPACSAACTRSLPPPARERVRVATPHGRHSVGRHRMPPCTIRNHRRFDRSPPSSGGSPSRSPSPTRVERLRPHQRPRRHASSARHHDHDRPILAVRWRCPAPCHDLREHQLSLISMCYNEPTHWQCQAVFRPWRLGRCCGAKHVVSLTGDVVHHVDWSTNASSSVLIARVSSMERRPAPEQRPPHGGTLVPHDRLWSSSASSTSTKSGSFDSGQRTRRRLRRQASGRRCDP